MAGSNPFTVKKKNVVTEFSESFRKNSIGTVETPVIKNNQYILPIVN